MTAEDDIRLLIQIVKKDFQIQEKKNFLDAAPAQILGIEKKVKEMEEELEASLAQHDKLLKERVRLEMEADSQNAKIKEKQAELTKVKTNKEYRALEHEIAYLEKQVDKEEERIIAIYDEIEATNAEVAKVTERIDKEKDSLLAEKGSLEEEMKKRKDEYAILEDEKIRILPHISARVKQLYERILKVKGDSGVANLVGDICQGCFSRVPPQKAHEIRKNNKILTCEVCGRILVYYPIDIKPANKQ